jgi:hypothetical protein
MGRERRVGGSGWAGVHGSFIGLPKAKPSGSTGGKSGARQIKPKKKPASHLTIDLQALPDNIEVQRAAKRVLAVQTDIEAAKKRLQNLESQLGTLMQALRVAVDLARPVKPKKAPTSRNGKAGQAASKNKKAKPTATAPNP